MINYINGEELESYKNSEELTIVKFTANWCQPCKVIDPIIEKVANDTDIMFGKVDIEKENELVIEYNIRSVPTTIFLKKGEVLETKIGVFDENYLKDRISKFK